MSKTTEEINNPLYSPEMVEHLLTHTMPYIPMWSKVHHEISSNAPVENYNRQLKNCFLEKRKDPAVFMKECHEIQESKACMYLASKKQIKQRKIAPKKRDQLLHPNLTKEIWKKGRKKRPHTSLDFPVFRQTS